MDANYFWMAFLIHLGYQKVKNNQFGLRQFSKRNTFKNRF